MIINPYSFAAIDPAISAFATASGATDLSAMSNLAAYLRAQSLLTSSRCVPMKSGQNAGTGSTAYGWGDLTANNGTLVASPTWGASGIVMNSTTQFMHITDFLDAETITVFVRRSGTIGAVGTYLIGQWDFAGGQRSWAIMANSATASRASIQRSADGGSTNIQTDRTDSGYFDSSDNCYSGQFINGGITKLWKNKTAQTLTNVVGSQTTRFNSSSPLLLNAAGVAASGAAFMGGTYAGMLIIRGTVTDVQREAIDDLFRLL